MSDVVAPQRAALREMAARHVGPGDAYALVDFPDHPNVGDSAIWMGEIALLREMTGRDPAYVSRWDDFDGDAFRRLCPRGPLLIHGGGNLGDIWPHHQRLREHVLETVHDRPVIQLPQSIHYREPARAARFANLAAAHSDFHLYVRDHRSLAFAERHFTGAIRLAPDSAFALGPQPRGAATYPLLALLRTDGERVAHGGAPDATIVDWLEEDATTLPPAPPAGADHAAFAARAAARVARGLALLSRGERIVTDRLHGHILALLLGIPHGLLDNEYGKIAAYRDSWTAASPIASAAA